MKIFRVIDKNTGMFKRDDFTFNEETEIGLEVEASQGLYHPKWNGTEWIEGGVESEPVVTVEYLIKQLQDTDYKIIKCSEYQLAGLELPYDIQELHQERQALRDRINEING